jgi:hypothetical protein
MWLHQLRLDELLVEVAALQQQHDARSSQNPMQMLTQGSVVFVIQNFTLIHHVCMLCIQPN